MQQRSKNQQWKDSGSELSFKDWVRAELNKSVHDTLKSVSDDKFSNMVGMSCAACNYKPYVSGNTVLGINKWLVYGSALAIVGGVSYAIWHHSKKSK